MTHEPAVFIVDDDAELCQALRWLVESVGLQAETFTSAEAFLEAYDAERPGCLVLDVRMRGMSGLDLQRRLVAQRIDIPAIVVTGHGDVPMAVRAMKIGVVDFLQKPVNDQLLLDRIHYALKLDTERRERQTLLVQYRSRVEALTLREREVMDLVIAGHANKQIAHQLDIAEKTVEVHRKNLMRKMQVKSAVELLRAVFLAGVHGGRRS
ncbi:MAG: response regulator [Planctomycetes bacterium]|nr:response regulator [Planctomycetota bacterium]